MTPRPLSWPSSGWPNRRWRLALVLIAVATVVVRARFFGNPIIDVDEEYYLLVGDRLLHGALPYVDLWDRKPLGLFVLFAGMRLLGGDGILAYQLVAAAFAAGTAVLIAQVARRIAPPAAALAAGLAYAPFAGLSGGQGGQTPIFYNLPVIAAAFLILRRITRERPATLPLRWLGAAVMLLLGVALQLKPNVVFEGCFFGLVLLRMAWREDPHPALRAVDAALWIAVALAPTAAAGGAYVVLGHWDAFAYANFGSIFGRGGIGTAETVHNLGHALGRLAPILVAIAAGAWFLRDAAPWRGAEATRRAHAFVAGWAAAAAVGFAVFGTYFNHYVLPLLPPLLAAAAPALAIRRRAIGPALAILLLAGGTTWYFLYAQKLERRKGAAAYGYATAARIAPLLGPGRCLFIFYGEPIYYHLTHSCLLTRWPFPFHLSLTREAAALGVDPLSEMHRILAQRPAVILDAMSDDDEINPQTQALLRTALRRDYRLVFVMQHRARHGDIDELWQRLPGR